ncbi:MAG: hypothetical protein A3F78_08345 [Burkholderiales bacterium RIFCSPLOWO2_12_FULL_61_40]|nr:MAG: hypothetical protein A3F78_08345 [Burkholderiales bacterium RIFCSPLOWO2_12_FULL_61_40]
MGSVGAYADVVFDDPAIHATIMELGGWPGLCRTEMKDLGRIQQRFYKAHRAYTGRGEFTFEPVLSGEHSLNTACQRRTFPQPPPTFVGDLHRARLVYQRGTRNPLPPTPSVFTLAEQYLQLHKNKAP